MRISPLLLVTRVPVRLWQERYRSKAADARNRRIPMLLTFDEWFGYWLASGHMEEYGRCRGQYVLSRPGDKGPYDVGNVRVVPQEENVREAHLGKKKDPRTAQTRARISASLIGGKRTPEQCARIGAGRKAWWAAKDDKRKKEVARAPREDKRQHQGVVGCKAAQLLIEL